MPESYGLAGLFSEEQEFRRRQRHKRDAAKPPRTIKSCIVCGTRFRTARADKIMCSEHCQIIRALDLKHQRYHQEVGQ